ncbi:MAG TPA: hypothetical protein VK145_00440, partial [Candidatus Nanoarchaeia archaeon]|nr:hypothetical protein [Candidatus Nanoarchaeia archaeon]
MKFSNPKLSLFLAVSLCVILAVVVTVFSVRVSWDPNNRTVAQIMFADYASIDDGQFINTYPDSRIEQVECDRNINCRSPKVSLKFEGKTVDIGSVAAGSRITKSIPVAYAGSAVATNVSFTTAAPFSVMSTTCGTKVRSNCTVTIGYIPTTIDAAGQVGTLTMRYYNGSYMDTKVITLTGKGLTNDFSKVLLVYNTNSSDSVSLKNYYLSKRPGVAPINTLGIATTVGENIPLADFESTIRTPIVNWMQANSSKGVKYIILVRDIPSRISGFSDNEPYQTVRSVQTRLESAKRDLSLVPLSAWSFELYSAQPYSPATYPGTLALVTHLDMGSVAATKAYIDKLALVHASMTTPN